MNHITEFGAIYMIEFNGSYYMLFVYPDHIALDEVDQDGNVVEHVAELDIDKSFRIYPEVSSVHTIQVKAKGRAPLLTYNTTEELGFYG